VLTEVRLPDAEGYALCRQITALPAEQRPSVIFLTTERSRVAVTKARLAGAAAFIVKPYRPRTLYQVLHELQVLPTPETCDVA
jgi:two-component system chemotaxis response regulator CheY